MRHKGVNVFKPSIWRNPAFSYVLLLFLVITALSYFPIKALGKVEPICIRGLCTQVLATDKSIRSTPSTVQNINFSFTIISHSQNLKKISSSNSIGSQITVKKTSQNSIQINFPMRLGSSQFFPINLTKIEQGERFQVQVKDSVSFQVLRNGYIFYSHRYAFPVFFVTNQYPIVLLQDASQLQLQLLPRSLEFSLIGKSRLQHNTLRFILALIYLQIFYLFHSLLNRFIKKKEFSTNLKIPFKFIVFFWITVITLWIFGGRDDTGVQNPSPFGPIGAAFSDMMQIFQAGKFSRPYEFEAVNYPPFTLLLIRPFGALPLEIVVVLILAVSSAMIFYLFSNVFHRSSVIEKFGLFLISVFSYPVLFGAVRGNFDLLASSLVGISFYLRSLQKAKIANFLLSIAIAIKIWPIIFLLILFRNRNFKAISWIGLTSGFISVGSLWLLGYSSPKQWLQVISNNLGLFGSVSSADTFIYSYSLSALTFGINVLVRSHFMSHFTSNTISQSLDWVSGSLNLIIVLILIVVILFLIFLTRNQLSLFLFCASIALLAPSISYTYRASVLVVFLGLRLQSTGNIFSFSRHGLPATAVPIRLWFFIFCERSAWLVVLSPTTFYYQTGTQFSTSSFLQPLAVVVLIILEAIRIKPTWQPEPRNLSHL